MRSVTTFLTGFIAGMIFLLALLWSHGSLHPVRAAGPSIAPLPATPKAIAGSPVIQSKDVGGLVFPVQGVDPSKMLDTFEDKRGGKSGRHEAVDIMAPRGTPVLAVEDGKIEKLFESKRGGTTIYQFDPTGAWCYYYAHLDRYATGIVQGSMVRKGQVIAYVGSTGDASPTAPHLHFSIIRLDPDKHWWKGTPVNPYPILAHRARQ